MAKSDPGYHEEETSGDIHLKKRAKEEDLFVFPCKAPAPLLRPVGFSRYIGSAVLRGRVLLITRK